MPTWLTIIVSIVGLISTVFGIFGISAYINERVKHRACERNAREDAERAEFEEFQQNKRKEAMREVFREEIKPLKDQVVNIESRIVIIEDNTQKSLAADVLALRCNMKTIMERAKVQGYSDIGDKSTMKQLKEKYKALGGNEFKNYVDSWCELVASLPDKK